MHVARLSGLNPDPSANTIGDVSTDHSARVRSITASPASRVPAPLSSKPSSFTTISAVLLSLLPSISPTMSDSGADSMAATSTAVAGAVPATAVPATETPRSLSMRTNSWAAPSAGSFAFNGSRSTRESLAMRASYGPASSPATPGPQLGAKYSSS